MNFAVIQMNTANVTACANNVRLMFMTPRPSEPSGSYDGKQRIRDREPHRETYADDERRVDQAEQQENLGLQRGDQFGLARAGLEEAAAHDADADAGSGGAEPDHEADADGGVRLDHAEYLNLVHSSSFPLKAVVGDCVLSVSRAPSTDRRSSTS